MISAVGFAALWGILSLGGPPSYPGTEASDSIIGPDHVPYVGQTPLLCGGAAAAILLRFWGERHVYGGDFESLVRPDEGGIATSDLVAAIQERGYATRDLTGNVEGVFSALADGVPSMLLLEGDPTLHYVVLVRADSTHAWIHDPNFGPDRRLSRRSLMELWEESGFWALLVTPGGEEAGRSGLPSRTDTATGTAAAAGTTEATGTSEATAQDTSAASAQVGSAMAALRSGDHQRARALANDLLTADAREADLARRILATSYHLDGMPTEALKQWNALGEPTTELLEIRGADHTRYHVLARMTGIEVGSHVTPHRLDLAHRRLADVPAVRAARLEYTPFPDGSAEVRAFVVEEPRWPGWRKLASAGVGALTDGGATLEAGPFVAAGDRWSVGGRWGDAQSVRSVAVATTARVPGIMSVAIDWRRERYGITLPDDPALSRERTRRSVDFRHWILPTAALQSGIALERWDSEHRQYAASVGGTWALSDDAIRLDVRAEHWRGDLPAFTGVSADLRARRDVGTAAALHVTAGVASFSDAAPRPVWPGAGVGELRDPLLRGHPLETDGVIGGAAFGPELLHATGEVRIFERFGPLRYGLSGFVDVAHVARTFVDPGIGLFMDTGDRLLRLDLAHGDGAWTLSAGVRRSY